MKQLGELLTLEDEFAARGIRVVALAKEMRAQDELAKTARRFPERGFRLGGLPRGEGLESYARTSGYLIASDGTVLEVFPMETFNRPRWWAILHRIDAIESAATD